MHSRAIGDNEKIYSADSSLQPCSMLPAVDIKYAWRWFISCHKMLPNIVLVDNKRIIVHQATHSQWSICGFCPSRYKESFFYIVNTENRTRDAFYSWANWLVWGTEGARFT